ncbi:ParB/RepB/Spo0J family partition protein [Leptospira interrogans]
MAKPRTKSKPAASKPATPKIDLAPTTTIPLDKLVLSKDNVRQITNGLSIEQLADSIARRSLLQSLSVRPILNDLGFESGAYEVQAGGRRLRALQLLVKQKRLAKTAPIPCIVRREGITEDDSLAENTDRLSLHPLDQFRAFSALRGKGQSEEDIAAAYGVTPAVVRQRLRLASASPVLLDAYAADNLNLEQLMAFCVIEGHARQEQIWQLIADGQSHGSAYNIRRLLTETCIESDDPRVRCVGIDAYMAAGGPVMRDLFEEDGGGWLQDPALLMRLLTDKLTAERDRVLTQGWKWAEICLETPYRRKQELRRLPAIEAPLSEEDQNRYQALSDEYDSLVDTDDDDGDAARIKERLDVIDAELAELDNRPPKFNADDIARGGALISVSHSGQVSIEYGFIRPEDIDKPASRSHSTGGDAESRDEPDSPIVTAGNDDDSVGRPLSDKLVQHLTTYRTIGLRNAVGQDFDMAFLAILHALCLHVFYHSSYESCLAINANTHIPSDAPGLGEFAAGAAIDERHAHWEAKLPRDSADLWNALVNLSTQGSLADLFTHCVSQTVNAVRDPYQQGSCRLRHADQLAAAMSLDMTQQGWTPTVDNYLGRVTKNHILDAVREAKGDDTVRLIEHLKKGDMAKEAQRLLADTGWMPAPLRTFDLDLSADADAEDHSDLPDFLAADGDHDVSPSIAAE